MGLGSLKELYLDELGGLYDAETQMLRTLPRFMELARAPELREVLHTHCRESRLHLDRLQLIFTHWGERVTPRACAGVSGIVQEADERLNQPATPDTRDAAIIGAVQRIEHYEIAAYGCARTYARRLNRNDEARLLQETLDEEGRSDKRLTEIAEAHVNDDARSEQDLHERRRPRLRYVSTSQLDHSRLSRESLEIRNNAGEDLGDFDGLLVDGASGQAGYVVVDAGGLFAGRKYLLPIAHVQFDERGPGLTVNLEKDMAARYPAFDPDEYSAMSEEQGHHYEQQVLAFFPPKDAPESWRKPSAYEPIDELMPDWLQKLTGAFAPMHAERSAPKARSEAAERTTPPHGDKWRAHS